MESVISQIMLLLVTGLWSEMQWEADYATYCDQRDMPHCDIAPTTVGTIARRIRRYCRAGNASVTFQVNYCTNVGGERRALIPDAHAGFTRVDACQGTATPYVSAVIFHADSDMPRLHIGC